MIYHLVVSTFWEQKNVSKHIIELFGSHFMTTLVKIGYLHIFYFSIDCIHSSSRRNVSTDSLFFE